ncbi:kelch-like protein [Archangium gephyra]|uniref:Kelch repeat-containing protein n=1 Tax=Archangium gephyra TaxID=48 RepID=UPI0035D41ED9
MFTPSAGQTLQTHPRLPGLAAWLLLCLAACTSQPTGSVQFAASVQQALSAGDVTRVKVTVSAFDMSPLVADLAPSSGSWGGLISGIPAGTNRSFLAEAFDASGTLRFQGRVSDVSISPNQTTAVAITLQQTPPPTPYDNETPLIDSVVASPTSVKAGGAIPLRATAHDPNAGDTLTWAWTATRGSFSDPSAAMTSWTAPSSLGVQVLTLTVTDSQGAAASVSIAVSVVSGDSTNAQLDISFNHWPVVSKVSATLTQLDAGQATEVSALVSDMDGDALSYQWAASGSCPGTWTNATSSTATFVPFSVPAGACNNCRLTVTVQDGRGGQTQGALNLCVTTPSLERFPPLFTSFNQSSSGAPGKTVSFEVTARDPQDSSLTFAWTANTGSLAAAESTATSSRVVWTAPACAVTGVPPTITAVVTNAYGLSASIPFVPSGLPACAPGWAPTGSMAVARDSSIAILLSSGKVLVLGGHLGGLAATNAAEVYDPGPGTWRTVASMAIPRFETTATLLPNGKVLVSAGYPGGSTPLAEVEVYDPGSDTWSATAPMLSARNAHAATLLPNGKVLVSGGWHRGPLGSAEVYDPASVTWSATGSMISGRAGHTATLLPNGKVLVAGGSIDGRGTTNINAAEVYDPASGSWSATAPMASARVGHTATLLPNGKVLVLGGYDGSSHLASAELYDPASGTWSAAASMASPHPHLKATLLFSGKVLVSGSSSGSPPASSAEVYDPDSDTWSVAAAMATPRFGHTATPLLNGQVLVSGGNNGSFLAGAELYTP